MGLAVCERCSGVYNTAGSRHAKDASDNRLLRRNARLHGARYAMQRLLLCPPCEDRTGETARKYDPTTDGPIGEDRTIRGREDGTTHWYCECGEVLNSRLARDHTCRDTDTPLPAA